jgi:hypothetical protein
MSLACAPTALVTNHRRAIRSIQSLTRRGVTIQGEHAGFFTPPFEGGNKSRAVTSANYSFVEHAVNDVMA